MRRSPNQPPDDDARSPARSSWAQDVDVGFGRLLERGGSTDELDSVHARIRAGIDKLVSYQRWQLAGTESEVDDITQEVMIKLLKAVAADRVERGETFAPLVATVTLHTISDARRAHRRYRNRVEHDPAESSMEPAGSEHGPEQLAVGRETYERIIEAIESLPEKDGEILVLVLFAGLTTLQIAEILGIEPNCARVRLQRAKIVLRKKLERCGLAPDLPPARMAGSVTIRRRKMA
ncbi:MAG: sigma-70 family RNA polymerase sigma factor [Planctomycetes bacterium]|nr:sigma-70 family RNA polymerase sigma factor [Planctomycetota bacterium]